MFIRQSPDITCKHTLRIVMKYLYHGLVDKSSSLKLYGAISIGRESLGVFEYSPLLLRGVHLH